MTHLEYVTLVMLLLMLIDAGILWLVIQQRRKMFSDTPEGQTESDPHQEQLNRIEQKLDKVLQRIGQLKVREADEEKEIRPARPMIVT